ncbi:hypothetical protein, partial [Staphylococcus epidermidis]|uniref:hypothetical protein n=1 Tax=Staphylococcus epidermidis TaxID=1282 RepID=UPI001C936C52
FKPSIQPFRAIPIAKPASQPYPYQLHPQTQKIFTQYPKTHNQPLFHPYSTQILNSLKPPIITPLPHPYPPSPIIPH